jgi:hypothetical protein
MEDGQMKDRWIKNRSLNSQMSPVLTVTLKVEQYCSHSGGGASVQVFFPDS